MDMKRLLENSRDYRELQRPKMDPTELLLTYKHLKVSEMMIYDYTLSRQISLDDVETIFEENCKLIRNYYEIEANDEMAKVKTLMKAHEFFLSKPVSKGKAKAVLILTEENQQGLREMDSSEFQAPHIVVLHKKNFILGCDEVRSATLLMKNSVINTLQKPAADKIALLLLAAYHTLNVEYPSAYQQFLRALEKLVTGNCLPSKYGQSQVQYSRFISLLKPS